MPSSVSSVNLRQLACEANHGHIYGGVHSADSYQCRRCQTVVVLPKLKWWVAEFHERRQRGDDNACLQIQDTINRYWENFSWQLNEQEHRVIDIYNQDWRY